MVGLGGNTFTFVATDSVLFKITDAFLFGDIFTVSIDGGPAFQTSAPGAGVTEINPDLAFANPAYSKASVLLASGAHSIDVFLFSGVSSSGAAYLEVESANVPDQPSTLMLFGGLAFASLAAQRYRRRTA